jgi:predicted PurR-regulated permease PerM
VEERGKEPFGRERQMDVRTINWSLVLRTIARWALVIGAIYIIVYILWMAGASTLPFIIGLVLAYLLLPIVKRLDRYMPRWASITAVYLVGLALFEVVLIFVVPPAANQIEQFVRNVPDWFQQGNEYVNRQIAEFNRTASDDVRAQVEEQVVNVQQTIQRNATTYVQRAGEFAVSSVLGIFATITFLLGFLVIPFFLFYILVDTNKLPAALNTLLHPRIRKDFWNIWYIVDGTLGQYIRGQLILGLIIGAASFIGLTVLNMLGFEVRYTVLLAIVAGIGELIPVIGPVLSAIPAIIVAIGGGTDSVIAVIILYVLIQQLENQILVPRIVGNTLRLHAAILMALLVIAGAVGGLGLVILSAPLAAIGRDVFVYLHRRLREPPQPPEMAIAGLTLEDQQPEPVKQKQPRRLLKGSKS